jgi:hypothetical protein
MKWRTNAVGGMEEDEALIGYLATGTVFKFSASLSKSEMTSDTLYLKFIFSKHVLNLNDI